MTQSDHRPVLKSNNTNSARTTWLGLVGDGPFGRRDCDKPADEHLPADRVGTNVDKYGKVFSIGFAWRPIVANLIQLCARSFSISLLPGGSILQSKDGPFLPSGEAARYNTAIQCANMLRSITRVCLMRKLGSCREAKAFSE